MIKYYVLYNYISICVTCIAVFDNMRKYMIGFNIFANNIQR